MYVCVCEGGEGRGGLAGNQTEIQVSAVHIGEGRVNLNLDGCRLWGLWGRKIDHFLRTSLIYDPLDNIRDINNKILKQDDPSVI